MYTTPDRVDVGQPRIPRCIPPSGRVDVDQAGPLLAVAHLSPTLPRWSEEVHMERPNMRNVQDIIYRFRMGEPNCAIARSLHRLALDRLAQLMQIPTGAATAKRHGRRRQKAKEAPLRTAGEVTLRLTGGNKPLYTRAIKYPQKGGGPFSQITLRVSRNPATMNES